LKTGYYLSAYIEINENGYIFGKAQRHDQNMSLWYVKGNVISLVRYWELERITYLKQCHLPFQNISYAYDFIERLLAECNISFVDILEVWGCPELFKYKQIHLPDQYQKYTVHSLNHIASAVFMDTDILKEKAVLALAVDLDSDTVADDDAYSKTSYTGCIFKNNEMKLFPIESPAILWHSAAVRTGLKEGTLMALGTAMNTVFKEPLINLDLRIYKNDYSLTYKIFNTFDAIIRRPDSIHDYLDAYDNHFSAEENLISALIKNISAVSVSLMERNVQNAVECYALDPAETCLAIAGGFGLNCPCNSFLMQKFHFYRFMAPPCINDGGQSLGMALLYFYMKLGQFNFKLNHAFHGRSSLNGLNTLMHNEHFQHYIEEISEFEADQAVCDMMEGPIVWFEGNAEIGPRALGHRSIFIDPRWDKFKDKLNKIKQRQDWRPVAPIVLEEDMSDWFKDAYPSPFMLHTFAIQDGKEKLIPAVLHLDKSARVQTINKNAGSYMKIYELLLAFKEKTGIPVIGNTSLNDRGEPILDSVEQAVDFALKKKVRTVYFDGNRIRLKMDMTYTPCAFKSQYPPMGCPKKELEQLRQAKNPHNITTESVLLYYQSGQNEQYDLKNWEDAVMIEKYKEHLVKKYGPEVL